MSSLWSAAQCRVRRRDARFHLYLEALQFGGPADGDEFLQDALLALDQEEVDAPGDITGGSP